MSGYVGLCQKCDDWTNEETHLLIERENEENRRHLRPGEILLDEYFRKFYGRLRDPLDMMFLCEIAIIFDWGPLTRPLGRKVQKEWWYSEGGKRSNPRWKLSGYDPLFVRKMTGNLTRCGIFTIEGDIWTFKGFPKGWERRWKKVLPGSFSRSNQGRVVS